VRGIAVGGTKVFAGTGRIVNGGTSGSNNVYPGLIGLDNVLASNPPKKNSLQIRRNVIHVDWGGSALLLLRGSPGAHLNISVFGLGGNLVTSLKPCSNCTGSQEFELDATGALNVDFDGTYDGNIALKPGIYFIVVSGAFSDRQPIVIKGTKSKT